MTSSVFSQDATRFVFGGHDNDTGGYGNRDSDGIFFPLDRLLFLAG